MAYEHKPGQASLFRQQEKKSDNSPDMTGKGKLACPSCGLVHDVELAAWTKDAGKGKFLSVKISEPYKRNIDGAGNAVRGKAAADAPITNSDIPW